MTTRETPRASPRVRAPLACAAVSGQAASPAHDCCPLSVVGLAGFIHPSLQGLAELQPTSVLRAQDPLFLVLHTLAAWLRAACRMPHAPCLALPTQPHTSRRARTSRSPLCPDAECPMGAADVHMRLSRCWMEACRPSSRRATTKLSVSPSCRMPPHARPSSQKPARQQTGRACVGACDGARAVG